MATPSASDLDFESESSYSLPLNHKRPFGAGIKRKRIEFVPQSGPTELCNRLPGPPVGDAYLDIVLPNRKERVDTVKKREDQRKAGADGPGQHPEAHDAEAQRTPDEPYLCPRCDLPILSQDPNLARQHEVLLAHQASLPHSHPPSHVDRQRKGLTFLSAYGWDPDSRVGLGATGEGRLWPVRATEKEGKEGIGVKTKGQRIAKAEDGKRTQGGKHERLQRERKKTEDAERMRKLMYGRDDVNKMLGVEL